MGLSCSLAGCPLLQGRASHAFNRGATDTFIVKADEVGPLSKVGWVGWHGIALWCMAGIVIGLASALH